jgi:hypothetical protein
MFLVVHNLQKKENTKNKQINTKKSVIILSKFEKQFKKKECE